MAANIKAVGVFGITQSGKTTLAKEIAKEYWRKYGRRSFVLDPNNDVWGEHALVMTDESKFWLSVWQTTDAVVIVDEAADTINRNKELIPVFTRLRHLRHQLVVIGHNGMTLLPIMREQLQTIYLFRQPKKAAEMWVDNFAEPKLSDATTLGQYEFIHYTLYGTARKFKLKL